MGIKQALYGCLLAGLMAGAPVQAAGLQAASGCESLNSCMQQASQEEDIDEALNLISRGIDSWKEGDSAAALADATMIRGQVYLQYFSIQPNTRLLDLAERDFRRVTKLAPTSYLGFVGLAMVSANRQDFSETESWFAKGFAADPRNPGIYEERAAYYLAREQYSPALKDLDRALELLDGASSRVDADDGDHPQALSQLNQERALVYLLRAQINQTLGRNTEASVDLAKACGLGETRACQ